MPAEIYIAIESFTQGYFQCPFYTDQEKKYYEIVISNITEPWYAAFNHFIKSQWISGLKFPGNKRLQTATKPRGELLIKTYELCKECHSLQGKVGVNIPWDNAYAWFTKCCWDFIGTEIEESLKDKSGNLKVYNDNHKEAVLERRFTKLRTMRQENNPYITFQDATGLICLIDTAIKLSSLSGFNDGYWKKFLRAFSEEAKEMKSERWGWSRFEHHSQNDAQNDAQNDSENHYYYRQSSGRGRPKRLIP